MTVRVLGPPIAWAGVAPTASRATVATAVARARLSMAVSSTLSPWGRVHRRNRGARQSTTHVNPYRLPGRGGAWPGRCLAGAVPGRAASGWRPGRVHAYWQTWVRAGSGGGGGGREGSAGR